MLKDNDDFTIEDIRKVAKRGKLLNTVLIVVTFLYFLSAILIDRVLAVADPMLLIIILRGTALVLGVIILILTIQTMGKMKFLGIEGGGQLLASSILFVIFAFFGFVVGLVVFILAGISIRKIKESVEILEIENGGKY